MSYNFKKIMDLELVNEVPEGANVLIETDGATKRLPSTAINSNIETPDWNQNDETAPDYVKNRTHYASVEIVDVLPETEYALEDKYGTMGTEFEGIIPIVSGETYQVTWNGVEYDCVCAELSGITFVGDVSVMTDGAFPSTGEPFIIGTMSTQNKSMIVALDGSTNATVSIRQEQETIHKMDKKYLPEVGGVKYVTVEKTDDNTRVADATYAQITEWINAGLEVKCIYGEYVMSLVYSYPELNGLAHATMGNQYVFGCFYNSYARQLSITNDDGIYYNTMRYADHSSIPTVTTFYAGPIGGGVGHLYPNLALSNPVTKSELATANNSIIKVYNSADGSTHYPVSVCLNSTDPYGVVLIYRKNGSCDSLYTSEYAIAN